MLRRCRQRTLFVQEFVQIRHRGQPKGNVGGGGPIAATTDIVARRLPIEAIAIIAGIGVFIDMGRTTVNVMGKTVAVLLVRKFEGLKSSKEQVTL